MIVQYPNSILSGMCQSIKELEWDDNTLRSDVGMMVEALKSSQGVGLAAPQIGLNKRIILVVQSADGVPTAMVNPRIEKLGTKYAVAVEECLSLPGRKFSVHRAIQIWYSYMTLNKQRKLSVANGFVARIIQHEIDHLNGITIADCGREIK